MVFSSVMFLFVFLPVAFWGDVFLPKRFSNVFLLIASLFFYAWGEPVYVLLMIISIVINYFAGIIIFNNDGIHKKLATAIGVAFNLCILGYYKYVEYAIALINSVFDVTIIPSVNIELPIGISFYTFQAISYLVDVYRGESKASYNFVNVALYISFFPQLIAGPIVKYKEINKQIEARNARWYDVAEGFRRFTYGLGKKVLISNVLGETVDTIWSFDIITIDFKTAWIGAIAYTFQIYYDFSGYSDMAIGLGKMFGFCIPENFNYPYLSGSISEFWRRWHISLGSWFREYVYIPLGGNKRGKGRTYINLAIVFLLTGVWHGANLSFVVWGIYNGFFVIAEKMGVQKLLKNRGISVVYSMLIVNFGWVLFRANGILVGINYITRMLTPWRYHLMYDIPYWKYLDFKTMMVFVAAFCGAGLIQIVVPESIHKRFIGSCFEAVYIFFVLGLSVASIASDTYNPFIYYQF